MKNLIPLLAAAMLFSSCHAFRPLAKTNADTKAGKGDPKFLEDISVSGPAYSGQGGTESMPEIKDPHPPQFYFNSSFNIERGNMLQFKYAILLDVEVERLGNLELYRFIDDWWGTPYRYGGMTQRGVDCSAFVQSLFATVYGMALPRVAKDQKNICENKSAGDLEEGDLVFFNTTGGISHVGVYLHNRKFVHAATSGGVMISDLDEAYWSRRFLGAGRIQNEALVSGSNK